MFITLALAIQNSIRKMKNNIWKPFAITLLTIVILLGMFYLPRIQVGETILRRVNILSEVQRRDSNGDIIAETIADESEGIIEQIFDSTATAVKAKAYVDSIPEGMIPIEDFSASGTPIMDRFYSALHQAKERPVRIAYYGDSYIEGDIITESLREFFQQEYGGCGVGFVDIQSITSGFRQTVVANAKGWEDHNANDVGKPFNNSYQGINGRYFIGTNGSMELRGQKRKYAAHLDTAKVATIYFTAGPGLDISASVNGEQFHDIYHDGNEPDAEEDVRLVTDMHINTYYNEDSTIVTYDTTFTTREVRTIVGHQEQGNINHKSVRGNIGSFRMSVSNGASSRFYGVALDGTKGITLDNFSMRGSNGCFIQDIPLKTLKSFNHIRPYDLIVVHFGLNTANRKQKDYSNYISKMSKSINNLKEAFPDAAILVISVGDREEKNADGEMHTMRGVRELVSFQRKMAANTHVAFWNLYEAMGGDGSIRDMVEKKQANLDYTHINFAGGKRIAKILFDVLQNGKTNYDGRKE